MNFLYSTFVAPEEEEIHDIQKIKTQLINSSNEERKSTVKVIKGLLENDKQSIGDTLLNILVGFYVNEKDEVLISDYLDLFLVLFDSEDKVLQEKSIEYSTFFIKDPKGLITLVEGLKSKDFYVVYNSIRLVQTLHKSIPQMLEEALLAAPLAISNIIELLDNDKEIIKVEGLLVLNSISKNNSDIQNIMVFQNIFDKLFIWIQNEEYFDGGIIVQDCLNLMLNLLCNQKNQTFFIESGFTININELFITLVEQFDTIYWQSTTKVNNILKAIQLINVFFIEDNSNTKTYQNAFNKTKILNMFFQIIQLPVLPRILHAKFIFCIANIINANNLVQKHINLDLIDHFISLATDPDADHAVRIAATFSVLAYLSNNTEEQISLVTAFKSFDLVDPISANNYILHALDVREYFNEEEHEEEHENGHEQGHERVKNELDINPWLACILLSNLIIDNELAKQFLLKIKIFSNNGSINIIDHIIYNLELALKLKQKENLNQTYLNHIILGYLSLLSVWLFNHTASVTCFLNNKQNVETILNIIQIQNLINEDPEIFGSVVFLVGIVQQFNDGSSSVYENDSFRNLLLEKNTVESMVLALDNYKQKITKDHLWFTLLNNYSLEIPFSIEKSQVDFSFNLFFDTNYALIKSVVVNGPKVVFPKQAEKQIAEFEKQMLDKNIELTNKDSIINTLQSQVERLQLALAEELDNKENHKSSNQSQLDQLIVEMQNKDAYIQQLKKELIDKQSIINTKEANILVLNNKIKILDQEKERILKDKEQFINNKIKEFEARELDLKNKELALKEHNQIADSVVYL